MNDKNGELPAGDKDGASDLNALSCIVSPNKKGFWQADVYFLGWEEGLTPDWFCTGAIGGTKKQIIKKLEEKFPSPNIIDGITGICIDCNAEHFLLESVCEDCGRVISDT